MTEDELKKFLIQDLNLEPAYFVGGFGGAILEKEEIEAANGPELIDIARRHGYQVTVVEDEEDPKQKTKNWEGND